jgi:hypothetical protein
LAERPNGLAAGLLLGDQLAPILALLVGHPPKMPHLQPAAEGWITRRLLRSHTTRDTYLGRDVNLRKIYSEYQDLKFYGYAARYEAFWFKAEDVTNQAAQHFATIKANLQPLL